MKEIKKCFSCLFKKKKNHSCENFNTKLIKENNIPVEIYTKKNIDFQPQNTNWVCFIGNKHPHSQIYCECLYKSIKEKQG